MTDQELLTQLQSSPDKALPELTSRYAPLAAAIAGRILPGRAQDIEEVAADTLITLWRSAGTLDADNPPRLCHHHRPEPGHRLLADPPPPGRGTSVRR